MTDVDNDHRVEEETPTQVSRLRRSTGERMIGGVCGGLGRYFGVDPVWFRLAFIVLAFGGGSGVLIYLVAWLIIPEERDGEPVVPTGDPFLRQGPIVAGIVLVAVGTMLLFNNLVPWFNEVMWPLLLVAAGVGLMMGVGRGTR